MLYRPCEYLAANAAGVWDTGAASATGSSYHDAKIQNPERFCKFFTIFFGLILSYRNTAIEPDLFANCISRKKEPRTAKRLGLSFFHEQAEK